MIIKKRWSDNGYLTIEYDVNESYIKIYSDSNNNLDRSTSITITGAFGEKTINITQLGKYEEFKTSDGDIFYDKDGNKFLVLKKE